MKTNAIPSHSSRFSFLLILLLFVLLSGMNSCEQREENPDYNDLQLKNATIQNGNTVTFWGHETFNRNTGKPINVKRKIGSSDLVHFEPNFVLYIQNGDGITNLVSSAVIKIDGKQIFGPSDFSQKTISLKSQISGLSVNSILEVELQSTPGSYIDIWIEGILLPGQALLTPQGGDISLNEGSILIHVPANAVDKQIFISIKDTYEGLIETPTSTDLMQYEMLPHGLIFSHPIEVSLPFKSDPTKSINSLSAYSESEGKWEELKILDIDQTSKTVQIEINHFSIILLIPPQFYLVVDIPGKFLKKGDLIYTLTKEYITSLLHSSRFSWIPGHVGLYTGTLDKSSDHNDDETIIESDGDTVRPSKLTIFKNPAVHLYLGPRRYNGSISDIQRNGIVGFAIDQLGKPWSLTGQGNSNYDSFSCVGLTEAAYDYNSLSIIPELFEINNVIYPYDQFDYTKTVDQITIKSGEKIELNVYGVVWDVINKYTKTADGVSVLNQPNGATWEYKISNDLLSGYYKFSWTPTQNDVGKNFSVTFNAIQNNLIGTDQKTQTITFNVIQEDTQNGGTVMDIDGNVYQTVTIGSQVWMAENLKTTKYNDGTSIPNVTDASEWLNLSTPGYCWYDNDISYSNPYGALYNWYTVNTGKLAPTGWHVPSDDEWTTLTDYLGGEISAGSKLKESGTLHWYGSNLGATNETGFTALPGGVRGWLGVFGNISLYGNWWSSTENSESAAWNRSIIYSNINVDRGGGANKVIGLSVRCVKD